MEKKKGKKNFVEMLKDSILRPITSIDENIENLKDTKSTLIFAGIIAAVITVCNLVSTMINTIFSKTYDFWTDKYSWNVSFSNLDSLDYVDLILVNLLKYGVIVLAIAGVYYLSVLVLKKSITYIKTLGIISLAIIPNIILSFVGSILGILWSPLNIFIGAAALTYTILILTLTLKNALRINDIDKLILYNAIIIAILSILEYVVFTVGIFG